MKTLVIASILALATVLAGSASAFAQAGQPVDDSKWSDTVIVVTASRHGVLRCPAMWKLVKGDAAVWVMPTLLTAKRSMSWHTACFKKAVKGANVLVLQGAYVSVPSRNTYLPKGTHLKDAVSPETYARFLAAAKRSHSTASNYTSLQPQWAANAFLSNIYMFRGLSNQSYPANMPDLGRDAGTPVKTIDLFVGNSDERNNRNLLNAKESEACLNSVLDRVDYTLDVLPGVITAWQKGDIVRVVAGLPDEDNRCPPPDTPDSSVIQRENAGRWTQALSRLLDKPGRSIAAVPLNWLLCKGGVIDQLRSEGITVVPPDGVEEELLQPAN